MSNIFRLRLNVSLNLLLIIRMANDRKIKTIRWIITSHPLLASVLLTNGLTEMILELTKLSNIYRLRLNVSFTTLINYFLAFLRLKKMEMR